MDVWELTEDELDNLAAHACYCYEATLYSPDLPWSGQSKAEKIAWRNVAAGLLIKLDAMGKSKDTIVIDFD